MSAEDRTAQMTDLPFNHPSRYCRICNKRPLVYVARALELNRLLCPECNQKWEQMTESEKAQKGLLESWQRQYDYDELSYG